MAKKTDFYKGMKLLGSQKEQELNSQIQGLLNNRALLESVSENAQLQVPKINRMQEASERMSIIMNYPTKKDVATVAKLVIQLEEKIDRLEEILSSPEKNRIVKSGGSSRGAKKKSRGSSTEKDGRKKRVSDFINESLLLSAKLSDGDGQRNTNV
ncbi:hypothetical protein ABE28_012680 [Peribacillus muralis]|uniref:Uncharacterized protein n=1 Tax=Peribacillus muralis TaxID=264697 RepID=A0A1B3XPR2_9BACI|nr:hypothetical protein [Peribacillus muralis]AOH55207.1 hypothetical protein ABE28_012680 [Peribacillus muralis]